MVTGFMESTVIVRREIMRVMIRFILALALFAGGWAVPAWASKQAGEELYTQVNMHYIDKRKKVYWTNYSVDTLIPVNTPVILISVAGSDVLFKLKESGIRLTLKNHSGSGLTGKQWAERHFSSARVDLGRFTDEERSAIEKGEVQRGMSREAVLVSRGYPPAHRTPSLEAVKWTYWNNRWDNVDVIFGVDGKVTDVRQY